MQHGREKVENEAFRFMRRLIDGRHFAQGNDSSAVLSTSVVHVGIVLESRAA